MSILSLFCFNYFLRIRQWKTSPDYSSLIRKPPLNKRRLRDTVKLIYLMANVTSKKSASGRAQATTSGVPAGRYWRLKAFVRQHSILVIVIVLFAVAGSIYLAFSRAATPPPGSIYVAAGGRCLDNKRNAVRNSNPIQIYDCNSGPSQHWSLESDGTIRTQGFCLDIKRAVARPSTAVQIYTCHGDLNQKWYRRGHAIVSRLGEFCLDNKHNANVNSNPVQIYTCNGGGNQQWSITDASTALSGTVAPPKSPLAVHIKNGQLVDGSGRPSRLLGVDATGTEWDCALGGGISPGSLDSHETAAMRSWHVKIVRVPLNEDCWLGINQAPAAYAGTAYRAAIKGWVSALNQAGIIAILDLHANAPGNYLAINQVAMADADHATTFWSQVAKDYKSNPAVMFDLFNEPYMSNAYPPSATDWNCWLNGCRTTSSFPIKTGTATATYNIVGMQQLVNTVRATGATQPLLIGGLNYANNPCRSWSGSVGTTCTQLYSVPNDPLHQLGLSLHTYKGNACQTNTCWNSVYQVSQRAGLPIVTGEFGESDCSTSFVDSYMNWADQHNVSYLAWTWQVNGYKNCQSGNSSAAVESNLQLLQSNNGAPASIVPAANVIKQHLLRVLP